MDNNTVTFVFMEAQLLVSMVLIYFTKRLSESITKYSEQVEEQTKLMSRNTELMDRETKLHEYENRKEALIRKRDRLVKEMENLIAPLYSILDSSEYFDQKALAVKDRYEYIPPPKANRDFIFNKKAYNILNFWEGIRRNLYLCQSQDMIVWLGWFFYEFPKIASKSNENRPDWEGFTEEIRDEIKDRYKTLGKEITNTENELEGTTKIVTL